MLETYSLVVYGALESGFKFDEHEGPLTPSDHSKMLRVFDLRFGYKSAKMDRDSPSSSRSIIIRRRWRITLLKKCMSKGNSSWSKGRAKLWA